MWGKKSGNWWGKTFVVWDNDNYKELLFDFLQSNFQNPKSFLRVQRVPENGFELFWQIYDLKFINNEIPRRVYEIYGIISTLRAN